jgi:DNA-binding NarL/FixJ family response regulator
MICRPTLALDQKRMFQGDRMDLLRVLLADDNDTVVQSVQRLLETEFEIVGVVKDGRSLVTAAHKLKPDIMIIDIFMPGMNGFEAARQLKKRHMKGTIIFLTVHQDRALADEARAIGAMGYVLKSSADRDLVPAIQEAQAGRFFLSAAVNF